MFLNTLVILRYFGEEKIKDRQFQRVVNSPNEASTLYIIPDKQLKFAIRKFKETFIKSGLQIIIVDGIEEIDLRIKSKALIFFNCESTYCNCRSNIIKEFVTDCKSKLGPYCQAHIILMNNSNFKLKKELEIPYSLCPFAGVFNENGILTKYEIEEKRLKEVSERILTELKLVRTCS